MERPRISLVTPSLNRISWIEGAIDSAQDQEVHAYEHIVMDGGSTDGTIERLTDSDLVRLVVKPDRGLYEGLNNAIAEVTGDVIMLLNSDDRLAADALETVAEAFRRHPDCDVLCGETRIVDELGFAAPAFRQPTSVGLDVETAALGMPIINAKAYRADFMRAVGGFNLAYKLAADREWLIRAALRRPNVRFTEALLYLYQSHADSRTLSHALNDDWFTMKREHVTIARRMLRDSRIDAGERAVLERWWGREAVKLTLAGAGKGRPKAMGAALRDAPRGRLRILAGGTFELLGSQLRKAVARVRPEEGAFRNQHL